MRLHGVTPSLSAEGVFWECSFLRGLPKGPGDSAGWGKDVGGSHVAIEENESEERHVDSVSRGKDDMLVLN